MARGGNPEQNPTLRGRRLAMELLHRREATGMSREEVARQLEWSTSTIFCIETGRSRPQPGNVRTLLELYGVTGPVMHVARTALVTSSEVRSTASSRRHSRPHAVTMEVT
jgi:transcriptional regulator with XRE-family HTH domain